MSTTQIAHPPYSLSLIPDHDEAGMDVSAYVLQESITRIGRVPPADVIVSHGSISREHAVVEWLANGYVLRDAGSTNGTFVNEFRLGLFPLTSGDYVRFGSVRFLVQTHAHVRSVEEDGPTRPADLAHVRTKIVAVRAQVSLTMSGMPVGRLTQGGIPWGWEVYQKTIPRIDEGSYMFGAIVVRGYQALLVGLSEDGIRRIEVAMTAVVSRLVTGLINVFRELDDEDFCIVIVKRHGSSELEFSDDLSKSTLEIREALRETALIAEASASWSTTSTDVALALRKARAGRAGPAVVARNNIGTQIRWLHVSDLHFGAGNESWRHDHEQVMTALIRDLKRDKFSANRVFVTGDVAFSATKEQYDCAFEALELVAEAVDLGTAEMRLIPGNHDVSRQVADTPLANALHRYARSLPEALDDMQSDPRSLALLSEKLKTFRDFLLRFDGHPGELDWHERIVVDELPVDIWGLCSVWASDSSDGRDERGAFTPNMVIGRGQYRQLRREKTPAVLNIVLTHHPLDWMTPVAGRWLRSAFASVPSVHLCGHVHHGAGTTVVRLGKTNNTFTLVAGAGHGAQNEIGTHAYSRCILRRESSARWALGWSPRAYDLDRNEFRIDRGNFDLDSDGYAWFQFAESPIIE